MKFNVFVPALAFLCALPVIADRVPYQSSARIPNVQQSDAAEHAAMVKVTKISLAQAQAIAQKAAPKARLVKSELDNEDGNVIYEVELLENGRERKVVIDAGNGKVLQNYLDRD